MSAKATSWVLQQEIRPTRLKFLLFILADNADDDGNAQCSLNKLSVYTSTSEQTVLRGLHELWLRGYLIKHNNIFRLQGIPSDIQHYVYRLIRPDTNEFYFGMRSCFGNPSDDIQYMGSGAWPDDMRRKHIQLIKQILSIHPDRESAARAERDYISDAIFLLHDPLCRNLRK